MRRRELVGRLEALAFATPSPVYLFASDPHHARSGHAAMRTLAMAADGGGGFDPAQGGMFAGAAAVIGAFLGAFGLWLANRMLGKAAFEAAMTGRFKEIMDQQRALHAEERAMWKASELQMKGEIVNLRQTIASLTTTLRKQGVLDVPEGKFGNDPLITISPDDGE